MSQQLVKKGANGRIINVNPKSWIEAIKDKNTGQTLVEILQGFNMYFLPYNGNTSATRCLVPTMLRKKGLWITYVKYDGNVYTEWYAADEIDDKSWGDSSNWRIGNNTLVGDITISSNGNWVINGTETEFKAVGEKGNTPLIRVANNRLQVSYDLGDTYMNVTENPVYTQFRNHNNKIQISTDLGATWTDASDEIAAYFRWQATSGDTQANNVGRIQISRDNKTWTNLSNDIVNNLHISRYIGVNESLPTSGIAEGTIYAKGPYYAEDDALNDNPIYRLWVYAWKGNTLAWQDNGEFNSIAAGIVQDTGDSETEVMSQKAVTEKLSELGSEVNNVAVNSFEKAIPSIIIKGYYINNSGKWVSQSGQYLHCWKIKKNETVILRGNYNSVYANYSIFIELPNVDDIPTYYGDSPTSEYRIVSSNYDGYICIGGGNDCEMFRGTTLSANTKNVRLSAFVDSIVRCSILDGISKKPTGVIDGYYIDKNGVFVSASAQKTCYYEAKKGDVVKISAAHNVNYASWAFYKEPPTIGAVPLEFVPFNDELDHYFVVNDDGFVATSYSPIYGELEYVVADTSKNLFQTIDNKFNDVEKADKGVFFYERTDFDLTIKDYYINGQGNWVSQSGQMTRCWKVAKGDKLKTLSGNVYPHYSAWAFFENEPKVDDKPYSFAQWVTDEDSFVTAPIDGYIAVSNAPTAKLYSGQDYLIASNQYENKTCLYIGDSISTSNNYHWKGLLEENYKLKYVRDKSGFIAPANGGIKVRPQEVEPENDINKSIWYRCANARMSAYEFDMISLFGGTNDMTDANLVIGSENDVAFVDDASTFVNGENVTDVRPESLTFASALMGCILMLRRDFPNKEVILPTVMPCGLNYGNWTDSVTGLKASEAVANLQLRIAEKFDLKAIPFYWDMRTSENAVNNWCDQYGVHPNKQGARRMQAIMAQTLCLK